MRVAIVGTGAVGTALAHALHLAGVNVAAIGSRSPERAKALSSAVPGSSALSVQQAGSAAPVVLLAVSDSAIEDACAALEPAAGTIVAHLSGSRSVVALSAAAKRGALVGGFHPLAAVARTRTLPPPAPERSAEVFRGAAFAIEGDPAVQRALTSLAESLGGHPFPIVASDKPMYHLGASMLAAFAAGLSQIAWDQMRAAGASPALASAGVGHLLRTVADNISAGDTPASVQTGPVARGDPGGLQRQEHAARALSPVAHELYRVHIMHNIQLAQGAGKIDALTADRLVQALRDTGTTPTR